MFCSHCGKQIEDDSQFCEYCGQQVDENAESGNGFRSISQDRLTELYNENYNDVYRSIYYIVKNEDAAQDILQDTFLKAFERIEQLENPDSFTPWVKQIGINNAKNYLKKNKPVLFTELNKEAAEDDTPVEETFRDERQDILPEVVLDKKETARLIMEILGALPDEQRIVVSMFYYDEFSVRQIAEELELTESAVKSRLAYGRKKIEKEVLALEKRGTKLYGLTPVPFLLLLLRGMDAQAAEQPNGAALQSILRRLGTDGSAAVQTVGASASPVYSYTGAASAAASTGTTSTTSAAASAAAGSATAASAAATGTAAVGSGMALKVAAVVLAAAIAGGGGYYIHGRMEERRTATETEQETLVKETGADGESDTEEPGTQMQVAQPATVIQEEITETDPSDSILTTEPVDTMSATESVDTMSSENIAQNETHAITQTVDESLAFAFANDYCKTIYGENFSLMAMPDGNMYRIEVTDRSEDPAHSFGVYYGNIDVNLDTGFADINLTTDFIEDTHISERINVRQFSLTEEEKLEEIQAWAQAYSELIENRFAGNTEFRYNLYYIDDDDIPELIVDNIGYWLELYCVDGGSARIVQMKDGWSDSYSDANLPVGTWGLFYWIKPRSGRIYERSTGNPMPGITQYLTEYVYENGTIEHVANLSREVPPGMEERIPEGSSAEDALPYLNFMYNGNDISMADYLNYQGTWYDEEADEHILGGELTAESMLQLLSDPTRAGQYEKE